MPLDSLYASFEKALLEDYFAFLKIPSISTDPAHKQDMARAAEWVQRYLKESGLEVEVWETETYPALFGEYRAAGEGKPTLLIYGHYDVQPVDPLEEWESPPFEPTVRDGEVYARGAQDNKGQILYTMAAIRALYQKEGKLPVNLKILVEGEEENGSGGLTKILESKREKLHADYLLAPDFDIPNLETPAVTLGLRGMAAINITLTGSNTDLHSGMSGGIVYNPNHALVELLASCRDQRGKITIEGFYDDVKELSEEERSSLSLNLHGPEYPEAFGAEPNGGEQDYTPGESSLIRPTLEINGLVGGYTGPGIKTVIPAKAHAKLSCRLVPHQDPDKITAALEKHLRARLPKGMALEFSYLHKGLAPRSSASLPHVQALGKAYTDIFGKPCLYTLSGGSVPVTADLAKVSGAAPAFMGIGLSTDKIHAPNEHFGIDRMRLGFLTIARFLQHLGECP